MTEVRQIGQTDTYFNVKAISSDPNLESISFHFSTSQDAEDFKQYVEQKIAQIRNAGQNQAAEQSRQQMYTQPVQTQAPPPPPAYCPPARLSELIGKLELSQGTNQAGSLEQGMDELLTGSLKKSDKLGQNIDELLDEMKAAGTNRLDNYPEPKAANENGEWLEKAGLQISGWGSEFLFINANVWAVICDENGEAKFSGPCLKIHNFGKKTFYFSSHMAGLEVNMPVIAGETYIKRIEVYRDVNHMHDDLIVDLKATYWHEKP